MELLETYSITISSDTKEMHKVDKYLESIIRDLSIPEQVQGNMIICLTEAINNAIQHGNANDPSKKVEIIFDYDNQFYKFTVRDQGNGFDYQNLPDPTSPENITKISGRGIFIIKNLADKIEFENNGSTIHIYFSK
ncbi:MAG: anti-sigma factor [Vicingaceae bacterium]|nr:MAG: anti-sigma factor [Vicingaceae bacterium]